jgi:Spy/CpxP family protein refolding chaperone
MFRSIVTVALLVAGLAGTAVAQTAPGHDPVAEALIPPEIVMQNQQALGLTDAQRAAIQTDLEQAQQHFTHLQFQLAAASEKLVDTLKANKIDRERALAALDAELALEREVKHTQLGMMIAVKNVLTPDQIALAHRLAAAAKP